MILFLDIATKLFAESARKQQMFRVCSAMVRQLVPHFWVMLTHQLDFLSENPIGQCSDLRAALLKPLVRTITLH